MQYILVAVLRAGGYSRSELMHMTAGELYVKRKEALKRMVRPSLVVLEGREGLPL